LLFNGGVRRCSPLAFSCVAFHAGIYGTVAKTFRALAGSFLRRDDQALVDTRVRFRRGAGSAGLVFRSPVEADRARFMLL
jgi:hypothetical protein